MIQNAVFPVLFRWFAFDRYHATLVINLHGHRKCYHQQAVAKRGREIQRKQLINECNNGFQEKKSYDNSVAAYCGQIQVIEDFNTVFPWIGVSVFAHAFLVKSVNLCYLSRFVIATYQSDILRIASLQTHEIFESFDAIMPSINEISLQKGKRILKNVQKEIGKQNLN